MIPYLKDLKHILENGVLRGDRTGTGTLSVFGLQTRYNLSDGFPAVTTKKLAFNAVKGELLWFIEGSGDERRLCEITHGTREGPVTIWTPNALAPYWKPKAKFEGDLGRVYGVQWRKWRAIDGAGESSYDHEIKIVDQLTELIAGIKKDPYSRRHILSAWNPGEIDEMALPPCHILAQFYVANEKLSCQMYQRSADFFLGVPFNIASYALLTHMISQVCDLQVGEFIHTIGDAHVYFNHMDQVKEQLSRTPYALPKLAMNLHVKDINEFTMSDFELIDYKHHGAIKGKMAV